MNTDTGIEVQRADGVCLGISRCPGRKRWMLYKRTNTLQTPLAWFTREEYAVEAMRFLERIFQPKEDRT